MKLVSFLSLIAMASILFSCGNNGKPAAKSNDTLSSANPFFTESKLSFQAADFSKIKDADYKPAFEEGIKQQMEEVQKIASNTESATFENTLVALEKSGQMLRIVATFGLHIDP